MHVVQALATLGIGGSEFVATELTEYLRGAGWRVTVLAAPGPLGQRVSAAGAEILPWPVHKKRLTTLRYIGRIRRWLTEQQPDIVHVHSRLPALLIWRAMQSMPPELRPALVTSMHGHYSVSAYSSLMARGDAVIAVSEAVRAYTLHNYDVEAERVKLVYGGADEQAFPRGYRPDSAWLKRVLDEFPELSKRRWLCLPGRLSRYKGHGDFINLVAGLVGDYPDLHGIIVGAGREGSRYRDQLEGLALDGGVADRITFTGERDDIREWMAAAELVFSLCSDPPEAFGRTVLEALCLGRPVVAWNHGGVAEILQRMYPFGAVPPGNTGALRAQTATFLDQAPPAPLPNAFPLEESMRRTEAVYHEVLERRRSETRAPAHGGTSK